uniref:WRKY domain-containing protein n=1 Tax=Globodera rostochiensis TaxID=31243 RepID=A0A914HZL7_GLORO
MKRNINPKNKKGNAIDQQQQQRHLNSLPGPSSSTTVSSLDEDAFDETAMGPSTSTVCGQQQNCSENEPKEVFIDRWKKEWKWLAKISSADDLERVRQENHLGTNNDSGKPHSWFGCKTNKKSKKWQAYKHCKYRALYAQEKEAIFHRGEHNHPIKKTNIPSTVTNVACSSPPRNTTTSNNNGPTTRARSTRYSTL